MQSSFNLICLALAPASINIPPFAEPTKEQLPLLEEKSEEKRAIITPQIILPQIHREPWAFLHH